MYYTAFVKSTNCFCSFSTDVLTRAEEWLDNIINLLEDSDSEEEIEGWIIENR